MNLALENTTPYSQLLPRELRGLGAIIDDAFNTEKLCDFLRIISLDVVSFIQTSTFLDSLKTFWEKEAKKYLKLLRKAEERLILRIQETYLEIAKRIHNANLNGLPIISDLLNSIEDALKFRQAYGDPSFYMMALGMLNGLCNELLKRNRLDILNGLVRIEHFSFNDKSFFRAFTFYEEHTDFEELNAIFNMKDSDAPWLPWFLLQRAHECWRVLPKQISSIQLSYSSQQESLKSSNQLNAYHFWNDLRKGKDGREQPYFFTLEPIKRLIKSMIRQIFIHINTKRDQATIPDKIHSIILLLDGDVLCLKVNLSNNEASVYQLKKFNVDSAPFRFIKILLKNPGKTIPLGDISNTQSVSKFFERTCLKGVLSEIFFSKPTKHAVVFHTNEILFPEIDQRAKLALEELLPTLKLY
jgi:hypothetical protein